MELYEVANGTKREFFKSKQTARDMADWMYDHEFDGIPFVHHHVFGDVDELVEFLNGFKRGNSDRAK